MAARVRYTATQTLSRCCRCYSQRASPHPALITIPSFLTPTEHDLLLSHSLRLLDSPSRTSAAGRKKRREWVKSHPEWNPLTGGFPEDEATLWEEGHFDGVIKQYRETIVRAGQWGEDARPGTPLAAALDKVYSLLPAPSITAAPGSGSQVGQPSHRSSPPDHLILHLLHLSSRGAISPHVDNLEAFGSTIAGVSLGGDRVMRFKQVSPPPSSLAQDGPQEFDVLLERGSAYIQSEPLRTYFTHEVLQRADWNGRQVGGTQRLSIMLRDRRAADEHGHSPP